jgi:hypothetical protein
MKRTITFYNSFEEQKIEEARYAASLSPIENLKQGVALIKKMYPQIRKNKSKRINFIKIA